METLVALVCMLRCQSAMSCTTSLLTLTIDVAGLQTGGGGGTASLDRADQHAVSARNAEEVSQLRAQAFDHQTVARGKNGEGRNLDIRNNRVRRRQEEATCHCGVSHARARRPSRFPT